MSKLVVRSAAEQVAAHLRGQITLGVWGETIPGGHRLGPELGVNHKTVEAALRQLEREGLLVAQGTGRPRRIVTVPHPKGRRSIRIAHLLMDTADRGQDYIIEMRHLLEEAGHILLFPDSSLLELGMDAKRVAQLVEKIEADAWIVNAASREVLQWFSELPKPAFAFFGRRDGLPIAGVGPDKAPPIVNATRRLIELGHRRITFILRRLQRLPEPAPSVRVYLDELISHGIDVGEFNLPDWEESKAGYQKILDSLFGITPPTAMIVDEAFIFSATQQFLAKRQLRVPEDVSLICTDSDPTFAWCDPSVAHIRWDYRPVVRRIVRWANNVSRGRKDRRQTSTKAEFVDGGTVEPAQN